MHLAIGDSGTNPTLQLHRSVEETSALPTLFFLSGYQWGLASH